jgi:mannosylglycoprotein endo-beta-mannosidase
MEDDEEIAQNMKLLLYLYEKNVGTQNKFNKSEIVMVLSDEQKAIWYAEMMNCTTGHWPIKYLGVPVSRARLHVKDWIYLDEKVLKRLDGWKGGSLSYGGKLILINACLSSIPTYAMSMYLLPKAVIKKWTRLGKSSSGKEAV